MHRSGTSLAMRALSCYSVRLPPNLLPSAADNPDGFQESADIVAINDEILADQSSFWDSCWPIDFNQRTSRTEGIAKELQRLACDLGLGSPSEVSVIGIKDPRFCRTLPFWHKVLGAKALQHGLLVVRHPLAVVGSIAYRDDMSPLKAIMLWLRYNQEAVSALHSLGIDWGVISFEAIVGQGLPAFASVVELFNQQNKLYGSLLALKEAALPLKQLPRFSEVLEDVDVDIQDLAMRFYREISSVKQTSAISEPLLHEVEARINSDPLVAYQLLGLETTRKYILADALAQERRGSVSALPLLGEDQINAMEKTAYKQRSQQYVDRLLAKHQWCQVLQNVTVSLKSRQQRDQLRNLLTRRQPWSQPGRLAALSDLNFTIEAGERIALIGHNGSGKTSLLRLLSGIYAPTSGAILSNGQALTPIIDQSLGYSGELTGKQCSYHFYLLYCRWFIDWREFYESIKDFAELGDSIESRIKTWSLGMKTRLSFALTMQRKIDGLALDEGLGAGDQWFQSKARQRLDQFIDQAGTLVFASHSEDLLRRYCTRGIILEQGKVVFDGSLFRALQLYKAQAS